jgi:hypothetical protein
MSQRTDELVEELGFKVPTINDLRFDQSYNTQIKPVTVAPKTPNVPQGRDTFQTPNYATDLLIPFIPKKITHIWECAAGEGKIVNVLKSHEYNVVYSDIRGEGIANHNFLGDSYNAGLLWFIDSYKDSMAIITNPPFSVKEEFIEKAFFYKVPFAFLINADYSGKQIDWINRGCEKIIPNRRIDYITPTGRNGKTSSSQFHSMWLTYGFNLGRTEIFVELSLKDKKENI